MAMSLLLLRSSGGKRLCLLQPVLVPSVEHGSKVPAVALHPGELVADHMFDAVPRLDCGLQTVDPLLVDCGTTTSQSAPATGPAAQVRSRGTDSCWVCASTVCLVRSRRPASFLSRSFCICERFLSRSLRIWQPRGNQGQTREMIDIHRRARGGDTLSSSFLVSTILSTLISSSLDESSTAERLRGAMFSEVEI